MEVALPEVEKIENMRIGFDTSPIEGGKFLQHRVRGTGFYTKNLQELLKKYFPENDYIYFSQGKKLEFQVDVVHYPYFEPFFLSLPFKKIAPTVVTVHDLTPLVFPKFFPSGVRGKIKWYLQNIALHKMNAIISDSLQSKKDIMRFTGIEEEKIKVVYLAAGQNFLPASKNISKFNEFKEKYKLPDKFALYVGDITWNKNLPRLVQAVQKANIPLVMVGKALVETDFDASNPWNQDRKKVQELSMNDNRIIKLGFVPDEDLVMLYSSAALLAMPSIYEGFGLPILEAMSCGCPVVTSSCGSLKEVAGEAASYVDAYSVDDIAKVIKEVFTNKSIQKHLSEMGVKQAKKFSWKKTVSETLDVYVEAVGKSSS